MKRHDIVLPAILAMFAGSALALPSVRFDSNRADLGSEAPGVAESGLSQSTAALLGLLDRAIAHPNEIVSDGRQLTALLAGVRALQATSSMQTTEVEARLEAAFEAFVGEPELCIEILAARISLAADPTWFGRLIEARAGFLGEAQAYAAAYMAAGMPESMSEAEIRSHIHQWAVDYPKLRGSFEILQGHADQVRRLDERMALLSDSRPMMEYQLALLLSRQSAKVEGLFVSPSKWNEPTVTWAHRRMLRASRLQSYEVLDALSRFESGLSPEGEQVLGSLVQSFGPSFAATYARSRPRSR